MMTGNKLVLLVLPLMLAGCRPSYELVEDNAEQAIIRDKQGNLIFVSKECRGVYLKEGDSPAKKMEKLKNDY